MMSELNLAEVPFEDGSIRFRYARYLSSDGTRWIRHGLFRAYHPNGSLASEGEYVDGLENGPWRDFHTNGNLAAEGLYKDGQEVGNWNFWHENGSPSPDRPASE
jgi:antitoxin component YwqK of YwqJK toxin-antitoxin module